MSQTTPCCIGGVHFATKEALKREIRRRIASYEDQEPFVSDDVLFFSDVLAMHPQAALKRGAGIAGFFVAQNPVYPQTRTLYLLRVDGSSTDWSWTECLRPTLHKQKLRHALRALIEPDTMGFKRAFFQEHGDVVLCPLAHIPMIFDTAHVDHIPPDTFETLVAAFFNAYHVDERSILFDSEGRDHFYQDTLVDTDLAQHWVRYHREHAHLRVISGFANTSLVTRGHVRTP